MQHIDIGRDFSKFPGARFKKDGPHSGEEFRSEKLLPALRAAKESSDKVTIQLDGVIGLPSSFLEEAFGGVYRVDRSLGGLKMLSYIEFKYKDARFKSYVDLIKRYIAESEAGSEKNFL